LITLSLGKEIIVLFGKRLEKADPKILMNPALSWRGGEFVLC